MDLWISWGVKIEKYPQKKMPNKSEHDDKP
jgi:hypothetical protein